MFHKVLAATGGSPWSNRAIEYAIGLAKDYELELVILHVITDTPPYFIAEAGASMDTMLAGNEESGRLLLKEAVRWAADRFPFYAHSSMPPSSQTDGADLVVDHVAVFVDAEFR